ncbi:MarR family winged helix-turn-helix transcriptional regulator [uncultured Vibrio sp.]|uniref:MarR family winged helix-turn-helix transcriptional regulator n=1 Tax=uncultured Vibrio sp. TaxID=114054 RepID=UPI0025DA8040|nr:MarR family transcriptional regulator [uncultured Vibrio sp.]
MTETFDRKTSFGWMVNVIASQAAKKFEVELKKHGLTVALWPTMMCLWEEEGVTQRDISAKSKVENSTTTRTIDKLEKLGLVERRDDPNSRRSFRIYLTQQGHDLKDVLSPIPVAVNNEMLSSLDAKEQAEMIRLLQKMVASV